MDQRCRLDDIIFFCVLCLVPTSLLASSHLDCDSDLDKELKRFVDGVLSVDEYPIIPGIVIERSSNASTDNKHDENCVSTRSFASVENYVKRKIEEYTKNHVLAVDIPATARFFQGKTTL